jgi:hypothetical protein
MTTIRQTPTRRGCEKDNSRRGVRLSLATQSSREGGHLQQDRKNRGPNRGRRVGATASDDHERDGKPRRPRDRRCAV